MVEFEVGDRASRSPNGLSIHANDEADQRLGVGERLEDVFSLVVQSRSADLDKSYVISASIEDQLLQPSGIQRLLLGRNGRYGLEANPLHGRVIFELHGCSLLYMQLCGERIQVTCRSGWRHDGVPFASTRGNLPALAACPARPSASGRGAGVGCGSVGCFTRNSSTYRAGRLPRVRKVATDSPPMTAIPTGPQNTLRA